MPWLGKLVGLAKELDFISVHTYPVWESRNIHNALEFTQKNILSVAQKHPNKPIVITEAGWATNSNGKVIDPTMVGEEYQEIYINELIQWTNQQGILTFVFEAFDEPWKGSSEALEPEKHWGLFTVKRKPKKVMNGFKQINYETH